MSVYTQWWFHKALCMRDLVVLLCPCNQIQQLMMAVMGTEEQSTITCCISSAFFVLVPCREKFRLSETWAPFPSVVLMHRIVKVLNFCF